MIFCDCNLQKKNTLPKKKTGGEREKKMVNLIFLVDLESASVCRYAPQIIHNTVCASVASAACDAHSRAKCTDTFRKTFWDARRGGEGDVHKVRAPTPEEKRALRRKQREEEDAQYKHTRTPEEQEARERRIQHEDAAENHHCALANPPEWWVPAPSIVNAMGLFQIATYRSVAGGSVDMRTSDLIPLIDIPRIDYVCAGEIVQTKRGTDATVDHMRNGGKTAIAAMIQLLHETNLHNADDTLILHLTEHEGVRPDRGVDKTSTKDMESFYTCIVAAEAEAAATRIKPVLSSVSPNSALYREAKTGVSSGDVFEVVRAWRALKEKMLKTRRLDFVTLQFRALWPVAKFPSMYAQFGDVVTLRMDCIPEEVCHIPSGPRDSAVAAADICAFSHLGAQTFLLWSRADYGCDVRPMFADSPQTTKKKKEEDEAAMRAWISEARTVSLTHPPKDRELALCAFTETNSCGFLPPPSVGGRDGAYQERRGTVPQSFRLKKSLPTFGKCGRGRGGDVVKEETSATTTTPMATMHAQFCHDDMKEGGDSDEVKERWSDAAAHSIAYMIATFPPIV